ncbi:MAG TPA: SAM-dependent methyltransferase [Solirubrobacteraceae bacterium]
MTASRIDPAWFEDLYRADPDPWRFATSPYEQAKYERTVEALGPRDRRFGRALEAGCSIGVLSGLLASRCDELLALDASPTAVDAARARLAELPNVRVEHRVLPEQLPDGPFDLVVCSEILYYWAAGPLRELLAAVESLVSPGGSLLAVHWRPGTRTYPLRGDEVHRILASTTGLRHGHGEVEELYLIDRYDRPR